MNNPISQIERTKDAYAGNIQGLQKRANVSKELIDLLAMQQLKKDLDAAKRNQMMQMQGNPATVKDQLQQGLMGEYRQQAAKEMGMMPSEGQAIARAQQTMPQGMPQQQMSQRPQMPQGMPQGAPQQPQGVMSQARPVQLAGGGIVAFNEGSEDEGPVKKYPDLSDSLAALIPEFLRDTKFERQAKSRENPVQESIERAAREASKERAAEQMDELFENVSLDDILPAAEREDTPASGIMLAGVPDKEAVPAKTQPAAGLAAVVQTPAKTGGEGEELGIREQLMQKMRRDLDRDPEAAGAARAAMIRRELGLDEGLAALDERKARREQLLEDMKVTGMDRFQELLTAASIGGARGVGIRGSQLRQAERNRRMAYENKLDEIENTAMELRRNIGTTAANEYSKAATRDLQTINNAATVLQRMDVEDRQRFESELTRKRQDAKLEIDRTNALAKLLGTTESFAEAAGDITKGVSSIYERIREPYEARRALLEQRAGAGDEQAKEDLKTLEESISLQIITDPEYLRFQAMLDGLDAQRRASEAQRAGLAAGLRGVQVADVSDEDESLVASYEGR